MGRRQKQQMQARTPEEQLTSLATGQTIADLAKRMTRFCSLELENRLAETSQVIGGQGGRGRRG